MSSLVGVPKNVLSDGMKKIMASSGLNFDQLKLAYRRGVYWAYGVCCQRNSKINRG